MNAIGRRSVELTTDAHREDQTGQQEQGPENPGHPQTEETEWVGEWQSPWGVAHDENGASVQALGMLQRRDSAAVIRVGVTDKLAAGGPVGDEIAGTALPAGNLDAEKESSEGEREPGDQRDQELGQVTAFLSGWSNELAVHGGYSTARLEYRRRGGSGLGRTRERRLRIDERDWKTRSHRAGAEKRY